MNYWNISNSIESSQIGSEYPQIQKIGGEINLNAENSLQKVYNKLPLFLPNLDFFIVHKKSIMTDVMSCSFISKGFLVSEKFKLILESFDLPKHKFFPAVLKKNEIKYFNYYWFFFEGDLTNNFIYEKSTFFLVDSFGEKVNINIDSPEKLLETYKNISSLLKIRSSNLVLKKQIELDIFHLNLADSRIIISDKLLNSLVKNKITGLSYKKIPETFIYL